MNKQEKPPKKISTGLTDFEIQEGKELELDEITKRFLENAHPDEIRAREIEQEELQDFLEKATEEEIDYAQSLIRLKKIQYKDWTEQGFPMKKIKTFKEKLVKKQESDIEFVKMIPETKKVPAILLTLTENDAKMMDILNNPDKLEKSDEKGKNAFKEWTEKCEGFATSDEQAGEVQKFMNAHEKISEKQAEKIQNLVTHAFPECFCVQRPWEKKEPEIKPQSEKIELNEENNYAA